MIKFLITPVIAILLALPAYGEDLMRTISVQGSGVVAAEPDLAFITAGVTTENLSVVEAVAANNRLMSNVFKTLNEDFSIPNKFIKTSGFKVQPKYVYESGKQQFVGYVVANNVSIKVMDLDKIGDLLGAVVEAGANSIHGIQFDVNDRSALIQKARKAAMLNAVSKASVLAESVGMVVGDAKSISESSNAYSDRVYYSMDLLERGDNKAVPISGGQQNTTVNVSVVFEMATPPSRRSN